MKQEIHYQVSLQNNTSLTKKIIKRFDRKGVAFINALLPTKGFVQLGHDVETISGCAYPSFGFGGRNSARQ